ncbi:MAG TPA: dienelactone hydrolase family protein [Steroidobacteraceae bacterium]|nr:dienelactone hydrolase family protein [Steroidobacteraceae bacterium]
MRFAAIFSVAVLTTISTARAEMVPIEPPAGTADLGVRWMQVKVADLGVMPIAIAQPLGKGPFPTVIILHGSHGFAREYVQLARGFAQQGVLAVAPCWFSGGGGAGSRFITPISCTGPPAISTAASSPAQNTVKALVSEVRALPAVRGDAIALFGHSLGGGTALNYAFVTGDIAAAVLDSAGYTDDQIRRVAQLKVAILILHGSGDTSADGGSAFQTAARARSFEAALRVANKPVEAMYYKNAGHNGIFTDPRQMEDSVRRAAAFISRRPETR